MTTRDDIFRAVRKALKRDKPSAEALQALERRLLNAETQVVPARAQLPHEHQLRLFMEMAREAATSVVEVQGLREVPHAVADYLVGHNLPAEIVMAPSPMLDRIPWLEKIPWSERPLIAIRRGRADPGDLVSLTGAFAGVAETGTLMLLSGPDAPTTLNLMPDHHLVVLGAAQVLGTYEKIPWSERPLIAIRRRPLDPAAHGQLHHRAVAQRRHRADAADGRPRTAPRARHPGP
jgi:L-lactate dehydrogenase complex protein LldG